MSRNSELALDACQFGLVPCVHGRGVGCTEGQRYNVAASAAWSEMLNAARADKVRRVAWGHRAGVSFTLEARNMGLVPHPASTNCNPCKRDVRTNMLSASVLRYRYSHRVLPNTIYGRTCWAEASYATRDL